MEEEYYTLINNNTWALTNLSVGRNLIRNKWVFKLKYDIHDTVDRYKAWLVAKGFTHREGLDYARGVHW